MNTVEGAFKSARIQAYRQMEASENAALRWSETTITEIAIAQAAKAVAVVPFTQRAEALSGADWIWWWVDGSAAYGMLVQAKRVIVAGTKWDFGFGYRTTGATRTQREVLMSFADALELLPVYAVYLGTGKYRSWERCSKDHRHGRCLACVRRAISLMPALLAEEVIVNDAVATYERSVALEEISTPNTTRGLVIPALKKQMDPKLADFLNKPQHGTRAVARAMVDPILRARFGALSTASVGTTTVRDGRHDELGPVFDDVPDDTGHWSVPYFQQALRPLQQTPPPYVLEIATGEYNEDRLASEFPENVAGIVVAQLNGRQ